ncbi:MAG: hypothetical protein AB1765_00680 [Candidatus Hydrogenedentota bacterium]
MKRKKIILFLAIILIFIFVGIPTIKRETKEFQKRVYKKKLLESSNFNSKNQIGFENLPYFSSEPIPGPKTDITFFKGSYIILQYPIDIPLKKAKEIGANSVSIVVDFDLLKRGREYWSERKYEIINAINLAHKLGLIVQLSGGFYIVEKNITHYIKSYEEYKEAYIVSVVELAKIANEYLVERFEVSREIDVVTSRFVEYEGWVEHWDCWEHKKFVKLIEEFAHKLFIEVKKYYNGKIGIGFCEPKKYVKLPDYDFIGITVYSGGEPYNMARNAIKYIYNARKHTGDFNRIKELVLGEVAIGWLDEGIELNSEQKKKIYNEFFYATNHLIDGYFVFIDFPHPDEELKVIAKERYYCNVVI